MGRVVVIHFNPPNLDQRLKRLGRHDVESLLDDLEREFESARAAIAPGGTIWLCWPKKSSGRESDLDHPTVGRNGLDRGLVDFKVAAIDATWSGLRFARKKR